MEKAETIGFEREGQRGNPHGTPSRATAWEVKMTAGKLGGEKGSDDAVLDEWKEVVRSGRLEGGKRN